MKTTSAILTVAFVFAGSLGASEAQARGGHSGGHSSGGHNSHVNHSSGGHNSHVNHVRFSNSLGKTSFQTSNKLGQGNNLRTNGGKNFSSKPNLNKGLTSKLNKKFDKFGKGWKSKWYPGKNWYGFGWGDGWDNYCDDGCSDDYCCQPWYYSPYYNVCSEYSPGCSEETLSPDFVPTPRFARIVNPAETRTTIGFAINGQALSLEAGQSRDVELTETTIIEFDRGFGNDTGRYTLSEGVYAFGSGPQGWELFQSSNAGREESVAAN